ncbi:MAG: flagellar basal body P-ring protein FlgI [Phycisphaerae bacterium]|nr:flagellar basal body P-ring protein FlgI [Phycisphaerae bacterium]
MARTALLVQCVLAVVLGVTVPASATKIADVTHLKGRRQNTLVGYGLVVGLPGTGDGGKYLPSIMQLASMLDKFAIPVPPGTLTDTKNVAIVMLEATLPDNGVREGDRIDVSVSSTGAAKSLLGGRLVPTPLQGPGLDRIFAFASGTIRLPDPKVKTNGIIVDGATMEEDVIHHYIIYNEDSGAWEATLVLEDVHASSALATVIAQMINESASEIGQIRQVAKALGPKNVVVQVPESEMDNPFVFLARIEDTELLMPQGEARIVINRKTQTIVVGEGVEIGPAVIAHGGMTITTVQPPPKPTAEEPLVEQEYAVGIGAAKDKRRNARLRDVVDALNQLNVPAKDIIEIVENLHRSGKIRGKLVIQE